MSKVVIRKGGLSLNDRFEIYATFGGPTFGGPKELTDRVLVHMIYVAEEIGIPETGMLGYIDAKVLKETDTNKVTKHHGYITFVIVRRLFQRSGMATKLITVVENDMKQNWNTDYITVNVRKTNLAAKHFFEHNNYTVDNEDEDAYHFVKQLKGNVGDSCSGKTKGNANVVDSCSGEIKGNRHDGSPSQETKGNGVDSCFRKTKRRRRRRTKKRRHDGSSSQETNWNGIDFCS